MAPFFVQPSKFARRFPVTNFGVKNVEHLFATVIAENICSLRHSWRSLAKQDEPFEGIICCNARGHVIDRLFFTPKHTCRFPFLPHLSATRVKVYLASNGNSGLTYNDATVNVSTGQFFLGSTFTTETTWETDFVAVHPDGTVSAVPIAK